jgi:CRISPR-associated protein Cas1
MSKHQILFGFLPFSPNRRKTAAPSLTKLTLFPTFHSKTTVTFSTILRYPHINIPTMQLFIDSYGAFIGVNNGKIFVKPKNSDPRSFPIRRIRSIFITKGVRISSDALILALEHEVPVFILDPLGHPLGQIWSGHYGSIATIRKQQALFFSSPQALFWGREILLSKIENQSATLLHYLDLFPLNQNFRQQTQTSLAILQQIKTKFESWTLDKAPNLSTTTATFRGWEGTASRFYFQALSSLLPPAFQFSTRSKRPALDPFNALLNYLYGILYATTELSLLKAGLDPHIAILHADQHRRPTLVFDFIEIYRHWAETTALELVLQNQIQPQHFHQPSAQEGVLLHTSGKELVVSSFLHFLDQKITTQDQSRKRTTQMDWDTQQMANYLKSLNLPH